MQNQNSIRRRSHAGRTFLASALPVLCLMVAPCAFAQNSPKFYSAVPPVSAQQAQVVFFRKPVDSVPVDGEAAHVYVNGAFHTALQPHSYTRFCVDRGNYSIEAHIGDAPKFEAKARPSTQVNLEGGKTYFVAVSENRTGEPAPVRRADAEQLLEGAYEQRHFVNRAGAIVPCQETAPVPQAPEKVSYTINADVLFEFDRGDYASITPIGREELRRVAQQIREHSPSTVSRVAVRGHADPIGTPPYNQRLSEQRARTVARVMTEEGIASDRVSVEGVGSAEPVVSCPTTGAKSARVACNAPNRRVEVIGGGTK
ncbi:OmpA family protein [Variovorax sp. J22R24]|uniref:OmpA family protein n=1 Tax=Variovorax gracilis TaxID=3053502 RepID=UPI0025786F9E|nr:OmpA family protein [Variovorax sp. J22R24]MDM0106156.1 OmpA family protein [Variovorax sp. J22R24]